MKHGHVKEIRQTKKTYRVWIEQVNATCVDVKAISVDEAINKGYAKWRRGEGHSRVSVVERINPPCMPQT